MPYSYLEQKEIEEAITFLAMSYQQSGRNPKPVVLHSLRMGIQLYHLDYAKNIVVGAILHDVIEDTDVSYEDLKRKFGENVARLVLACSFDASIEDKTEQYKDACARCVEAGRGALIIKIVDYIDNLPYMLDPKYAGDLCDFLRVKSAYFMKLVKPVMSGEKLFQELEKLFNTLSTASF